MRSSAKQSTVPGVQSTDFSRAVLSGNDASAYVGTIRLKSVL